MSWLDGITNSMFEFEQAPGVGDRQGSLLCCSPWGRKELDMTELSLDAYCFDSLSTDNVSQGQE